MPHKVIFRRGFALLRLVVEAAQPIQPQALVNALQVSRPTVNRTLRELVGKGWLEKIGEGPATRYRATEVGKLEAAGLTADPPIPQESWAAPAAPSTPQLWKWSPEAEKLLHALDAPLGNRAPVGYDRNFVDAYVPNHSSLLPHRLAADLYQQGRSPGQQPAGTYAREVLEQLLTDLSWSSSRLEGNQKSLLDTQTLFERGEASGAADEDTLMLLNHKDAIEFMVEAVPTQGITVPVVVDLQSKLMRDLMKDSRDIGRIRQRVVNIDGSVYTPNNMPIFLSDMLDTIVEKVRHIRNPVEAAFFLWVNIAYLQPFADGNKRTSRLSANMPLMLYNCAPLSFLDVERTDYALAMMGVYELQDVTAAVDLFEFIYLRSIRKYSVLRASMAAPDPLRIQYRHGLNELMQGVVAHGQTLDEALSYVSVQPRDRKQLRAIAEKELHEMEEYNCARYGVTRGMTRRWIEAGRKR